MLWFSKPRGTSVVETTLCTRWFSHLCVMTIIKLVTIRLNNGILSSLEFQYHH